MNNNTETTEREGKMQDLKKCKTCDASLKGWAQDFDYCNQACYMTRPEAKARAATEREQKLQQDNTKLIEALKVATNELESYEGLHGGNNAYSMAINKAQAILKELGEG